MHETQCSPLRVHRMNRKAWFEERLTPLRNSSRKTLRKRFGSASTQIFFTETIFPSKFERERSAKGADPVLLHFLPYLQQNRGGGCRPARLGKQGCFLQKQQPSGGIFWRAQVGLVAICTPIFTKYTPCPFFGNSFFLKLRKLTNFVTILVFFP